MITISNIEKYKADPKNANYLEKVNQLFHARDVEGMVSLIADPNTDPCLRLLAWGESMKDMQFLFKIHPRLHKIIVNLATT